MTISLSRLKARYLDASSSKVLFLRYQPPRPALHVSPEYRLVRRRTVLPLCVSAKPSTVGVRGLFGADRHALHPAWNIFNYRRARLEPLNRQGRRDLRRHQDWVDSSIAGTWPWPPGWLDERCMPKCVRKPFWCSDP